MVCVKLQEFTVTCIVSGGKNYLVIEMDRQKKYHT